MEKSKQNFVHKNMETEKSEINWEFICRICLKSSDSDMKFIFDVPSIATDEDIVGKIIKCGGIPVEIEDGMPDRICHQCSIDLEIAYTFRNTCQGSYYKLLEFIKTKEHSKDFKLEAEPEAEFIKQELDSNYEPDFFPEETKINFRSTEHLLFLKANEQQDSLDIDCSTENSLLFEQNKRNADEVVGDTIKTELPSLNIKKIIKKSKEEKKNGTRDRKPDPISKFICHICGNIYDTRSRLGQHIRLHTVQKDHECEICGKKFAAAAQIPRHMNTHTGNRPYKCRYCASSFGDISTRNKHERIHTNERPFECLECGKSFAYAHVLKVHMSIHTGERPYSCSVCDKKFRQRHHQQLHERTHSNVKRRKSKIQ